MRAVLCVLLFSTTLWAQSVKMPAEVKLDPTTGLPVRVVIEWEGDDVQFTDKLSDDLFIFREHSSDPRKISLVLMATRTARENTYYLNAVACKDKKMCPFVVTKVMVGKGTPPTPPDPPAPPPGPLSPLAKSMRDAAAGDLANLKALGAFWEASEAYLDVATIDTVAKLQAEMRANALKLVPADKVIKVRELAADEWNKAITVLPDAVLTVDHKQVIRAFMKKVAAAMKEGAA